MSKDPKTITQVVADASKAADFICKKVKLNQRPTIDLSDIGKGLKENIEHAQNQDIGYHGGVRR